MKKLILLISASLFIIISGYTQEEEKKEDKPVRSPFNSGYLIDNQTTYIGYPKTLGMYIQHKFGTVENGTEDIWGIYKSANVRLALDYVIKKNLQLGWGLTRSSMVHDFNVKYTIFEQTRKNTMPIALGVYGNMGISQLPEENFGTEYKFSNRLSYFGQIIIGRKFNDRITVQTGASFSHFNQVDTALYNYDRIGIHFNGRVKVTETGSFLFTYDQPLKALALTPHKDKEVMPNISFGWEIATVSHQFQLFMGYSEEILPQFYMQRAADDMEFGMFRIGFTMTRMWNF